MNLKLILEFAVVLGALVMGVRAGGVSVGWWGTGGLLGLGGIIPALRPMPTAGGLRTGLVSAKVFF